MVLLAFDDTDGPDGGCTTHMALRVLAALPGLALRGLPRLVRLNPNVPWKTRGNAAVVLPLGHPTGPQARVGELDGREILAYPESPPAEAHEVDLDAVWRCIQAAAQPGSQPAVALFAEPPPAAAYWQAVSTLVGAAEARSAVEALGQGHRSTGEGRALVGCLAAAAWPGPPSSYEFIAYRRASQGERKVEWPPLRLLDATGATFHTWDPQEDRPCCIPHTPCPVLCGLRGRDPDELRDAAVRALLAAAQEPVQAWLLWATNQASGDHVTQVDRLAQAPPAATVQVAATVAGEPDSRAGGHVFVPVDDDAGTRFHAVAFEPTRGLRETVRGLRPGDRIVAVGSWGEGIVRLEKLGIERLAPVVVKVSNPPCPSCGKSMKSHGATAGYRCPGCGTKAPESAASFEQAPRTLKTGWHEVPVIARRHLHQPLGWDAPGRLPMAPEAA